MSDLPPPVPQAPLSIRLAGFFGVLAGLVDAVCAVGITLWSVGAWHEAAAKTGPKAEHAAVLCLWIACGLCLTFSLFAFSSGLSLLMGWRFGRKLAFALLPLALLTAIGSQIAGAVGKNLAELEIQTALEHSQALYSQVQIRYFSPVPFLGLAAGVAVLVMVMQESARAWAGRRGPWAPPGEAPAEPAVAAATSVPALLSLIFAFLPFLMLTQLASIVLGAVALRQIRRSEGRLCGRWMALTGLIVSSLLWLLILLAVGAAIMFTRLKPDPAKTVAHGPDAVPTAPAEPPVAPSEPAPEPPASTPPEPAPAPPPAVEVAPPPPAPARTPTPTPEELADEDATATGVAAYLAETAAADGLVAKANPDGSGMLYLHAEPLLRGAAIADAQVITDDFDRPAISLTWAESAGDALANAPEGKMMALVVDGRIIMAAVVRGPLGRHMQISGHWTLDQAAALAKKLRGK